AIARSATTIFSRGYTPHYLLPGSAGGLSFERDLFAFALSYAEFRLGRHPFSPKDSPGDADGHFQILKRLESGLFDLSGLDRDEQMQLTPWLSRHLPTSDDFDLPEWFQNLKPD